MLSYDFKKLHELLKDFYNLTNIKICLYDSSERELFFYPKKLSPFCALLRTDKDMDYKCKECDKLAFSQCKKTHKQYVYTCHAGLIECISPIIYDENIIGYIVVGQIKPPNKTAFNVENVSKELAKLLEDEFENLPSLELDKIYSAIRVLDACAGYEYLKNIVKNSNAKIDAKIAEYVNSNLDKDLSVSSLCKKFHLFHNEIYNVFKENFHASPAEYVKERRYGKACELLVKTDMPVGKIATLCGVPDYNYFSKVFKKKYGLSPREYRKLQTQLS